MAPADGSPEALLGELLNRSGIQRSGVSFVNLTPLEREGQAGGAARERAAETLRSASAVVVVSKLDPASAAAAAIDQFAEAGVNVVDLATLPSIEESAEHPPVESGGPGAVKVVLTGTPMIASAVSEEMTATLGLVWRVVVPGLIVAMMCVVWHPVVGLATVAAVTLPLALTLGVMGWAGLQYDLGVVLIAGLAAGMALDAAVHYVSWFRRGIAADLFRHEAARMAFARCAPATVDGALAIGLGFSALALSPVTILHQLGLVALGLEVALLFGVLVVLPAIMASPLAAMMGARSRSDRIGGGNLVRADRAPRRGRRRAPSRPHRRGGGRRSRPGSPRSDCRSRLSRRTRRRRAPRHAPGQAATAAPRLRRVSGCRVAAGVVF